MVSRCTFGGGGQKGKCIGYISLKRVGSLCSECGECCAQIDFSAESLCTNMLIVRRPSAVASPHLRAKLGQVLLTWCAAVCVHACWMVNFINDGDCYDNLNDNTPENNDGNDGGH